MAHHAERESCISTEASRVHGWVDVKIRSAVNVRPRHHRYCVFENGFLHMFKYPPVLVGGYPYKDSPPCRTFAVKHVDGARIHSSYRKNTFLVTGEQEDGTVKVLEIDPVTEESRDMWMSQLVGREGVSYTPKLSPRPTNMLKLGTSIHRGLGNQVGENNCFLNVILQSFWHLRSMRVAILNLKMKSTSNPQEVIVLTALKELMEAYQDPTSGILHPGALRRALSQLYAADKMFQRNAMADAEETLIALLNLMDQQCVLGMEYAKANGDSNIGIDPRSIPQVIFGHDIQDRKKCQACTATTDWELFSNLVFSVYVMEMIREGSNSMENVLRILSSQITSLKCPKYDETKCSGTVCSERIIRRFPQVFAISLIWSSGNASREEIHCVLSMIGEEIDLSNAFYSSTVVKFSSEDGSSITKYSFRGFICYYGQHYFAFFYSTTNSEWLLFDDSHVTPAGSWNDVMNKCLKGKFQPVLIFYERPTKSRSFGGVDYDLYGQGKSLLVQGLSPSTESPVPCVLSSSSIGLQRRKVEVPLRLDEYEVSFPSGSPLGVVLQKVSNILTVVNFAVTEDGLKFPAELSGRIQLMDSVISANGYPLGQYPTDRAIKMIQSMSPPIVLRFRYPKDMLRLQEMGFDEKTSRMALLHADGNVETAANRCFEMLNQH